ncbi:MAG: hypothetical protein EAX96_10530 [Candidatus Lokiarchaeota archaeon]|nr:hypothetical protein [Candidatus Lokiarchaeota archaeon]
MIRYRKKFNLYKRILMFLIIGIMISSIFLSLGIYNLSSIINDNTSNTPNPFPDAPLISMASGEVNIYLVENAGLERINEPFTYEFTSLASGVAHHDSIRVYDGSIEIPSQTWNMINHANQTFENCTDWSDPTGWLLREPENTSIEIIPNYYGWGKVAYCTDENSSDYFQFSYDNPTSAVSGNYTFLIMPEQTDKEIRIGITGDPSETTKATIEFGTDGHFKVGVPTYQNLDTDTTYEAFKWYLISLEFNCTSDIMTVYINGTQKSENSFSNTADNIYQFYISSFPDTQTNCGVYLAWMDYSWASDYSPQRYNYLKSCNVTFLANVSASSYNTYNISYNSTSLGDSNYPVMITGISSVTDSHGTVWGLATTGNNYIGNGVTGPEGVILSDAWSGIYADGQNIPEFVEKGPIFCTVFQNGTNFYKFLQIYDNGYVNVKLKDDNSGADFVYACTAGAGADEMHYSVSSSWLVRDPCYIGGGSSDYIDVLSYDGTYNGKYFLNRDAQSWIFAQVIDTSQPEANDFTVRARVTDNTALPILGRSSGSNNLNANVEYEFWYVCLDGGSTDLEQQTTVDNLHTKLIRSPISEIGMPRIYNKSVILNETVGLDRINEPVTITLSSASDSIKELGNYDGMITFYDDEVGSDPAGWNITNDGTYGTIQVISEHDDHKKVLELYDTSILGGIFADLNIDASGSTGVIEFHYAISSLPDYAYYNIYFLDSSNNELFGFLNPGRETPGEQHKFGLTTGTFYDEVYDSNGNNIYLDNSTFFKCKFTFDFTANTLTFQYALPNGEYQYAYEDTSGLDYTFPLSTAQTTVDKVEASTGYTATNYYMWIDSLDFSWSDGYYPERINDLIYKNIYSDSIRAYDGLTEIPSQVWDGVYDTFDMDHNFESSTDWADPVGWTKNEEGPGTDIRVIPNYYGHSKVCELYDYNDSDICGMYDTFSGQVTGAAEFWLRVDSDSDYTWVALANGIPTNWIAWLVHRSGEPGLAMTWGGSDKPLVNASLDPIPFEPDTWYHMKWEFNCSTDSSKFYIDGNKVFWNNSNSVDEDFLFYATSDQITNLYFGTSTDHENFSVYVDAVDYSWESGYFDGRNKYLTSCEVSFLANMSAHSIKTYGLNFSSISQGDPGYPTMETGTDYIDDGLGGRWYLETTTNIQVMGSTSDPNGNFVSAQGTGAGILQLCGDNATGTRFMDKGPIFCQAYRTQTGGYAIVDVYASGIARARVKDDSDYCVGTWGLRDGVGTEEHHYKIDESWSVRDPITDGAENDWTWGIVTSNNYDGRSLFNNDGESWILATLVDVNQAGTTDFCISAYTAYSGGHIFYIGDDNTGPSLPANTETEIFWVMINSTADNDIQQRNDVDNLYVKLISNPLFNCSTSSEIIDVNIEAPINIQVDPSTWTNDKTFNVSWTNPSDPSGIIGAYYKIDNPPTSDTNGNYVSCTNIENISDIYVNDGNHTIYIWLKDGAGNVEYTNYSMTFLLNDSSVPQPIGLIVEPSSWSNISSFNLSWTNGYDPSGIVGAFYKIGSSPDSSTDGTYVAGADIERIENIVIGSEGSHLIYVWLNDSLGNNRLNWSVTNLLSDFSIAAPNNLTANPSTWTNHASFSVSWNNSYDSSGIIGAFYKLYSAPTTNYDGYYISSPDIEQINGITTDSDGAHTIYVWLQDNAGNIYFENRSSTILYNDSSISAPIGLTAQPSGRSNINSFNLTWTNPSDFSGIAGVYYKLYSAPTSDTDGFNISGSNIQSLNGIFVIGNGSHVIYIWLWDNVGNIHFTNYSITYLNLDIIPPNPPSITYAQAGGTSATLYWNLIFDGNVDHYNIYRSSSPIGDISGLTPIASVDNMTGTFTDTGLEDGTYYYIVTAVDDLGQESLVSNNVMVEINFYKWIIIIVIIVFGITGGTGATSYVIYRRKKYPSEKGYKPKEYDYKGPLVIDVEKEKAKKGPMKYTKQLDPDLIELYKQRYSNKSYIMIKDQSVNLDAEEFFREADFSDREQKEFIGELSSITAVERRDLLNSIKITENMERLELMKIATIQNIEIFEENKNYKYLKEEYYKLLSIAEKLGDDELFSTTLEKIEELKILLDSQEF